MLIDISLKHFSKTFCEGSCAQISRVNIAIDGVVAEILFFFVQSDADFNFVIDVFLRPVLDTDEAQFEWNFLIENHLGGVCTSVHDVNFCDNSQSSGSFRIPLPSQVKALRSRHVCICWNDSQNDGSLFSAVAFGHISGYSFDVHLLTNRYTSDTR